MFLIDELNYVMELDYPSQKVVQFHPDHLKMMPLNEFDRKHVGLFSSYREYIEAYAASGLCFSAMQDGVLYACFGINKMFPHVYEAWLIPSAEISKKAYRMHKASLKFFDHAVNKLAIQRLQITVCTRNVRAVKWAERCYFEHEGLLRNFSADGDDYYMMSRIT